jgi:hypothetical protein
VNPLHEASKKITTMASVVAKLKQSYNRMVQDLSANADPPEEHFWEQELSEDWDQQGRSGTSKTTRANRTRTSKAARTARTGRAVVTRAATRRDRRLV